MTAALDPRIREVRTLDLSRRARARRLLERYGRLAPLVTRAPALTATVGLALIVYGVGSVSRPAGFIVAGAVLLLLVVGHLRGSP